MSIRCELLSNGREWAGLRNHLFLLNHVSGQVHVCSLPGEHMTTSIHDVTKTSLWKQWDALGNVPVGPSIHSGVTLTPHECFGEQNNNFQDLP